MNRMTLLQRFSILCFLALSLFGIIFGWVVTNSLEQGTLTRSNEITANVVTEAIRNEFVITDFTEPKVGSDYNSFTERVSRLSLGPDIERIKIWNRDEVVVWADDNQLVGQQFPGNDELIVALNGEVISKLTRLEKKEQEHEVEFKRLLELYVPVRFENQADIEVVFEIYKNLDPLYIDISRHRQVVWTSITGGFLFLFFILLGIVRAASRRIEVQNRDIRNSEIKYRSLVESAQDGIISITSDGTIILFNRAAESIFGYSAKEMVGRNLTMLMPESYQTKHQSSMRRFFETGEPTIIGVTVEVEGLHKDGHYFPMELSLAISGEADNQIVTGVVRNITERKAMQAQLIEGEKQAMVSLLASSIGHELNNNVSGLLGFADLLRDSPDDRQLAQECAEVFSGESQRLKVHAANLLALGKPKKPEVKPISLNSLLDKVSELLVVSGLLKSVTIIKEYAEELPPFMGDEMQLEQVIRNLEINSAHAMEGREAVLIISTRLSVNKSSVELCIRDTGHGIPDDKLDQIFVPFYSTKKENGKGTGLGMHIVKQIIEDHNGNIHVESQIDIGTAVTVVLPIVR